MNQPIESARSSTSSARCRAHALLRRWFAPALVGAAVAAGGVFYATADAVPAPAQTATPSKVGLVDMTALINGLTELKDRNAAMKPLRDQMASELEQLQTQAKQLESDLKDGIPEKDVQRRIETRTQLQETSSILKLRKERWDLALDLRNAQVIRELYAKATEAIAEISRRDGYDLILLDDRPVPMTDFGNMGQLREEVLMKRVLFAAPTLDITQRVLTAMENQYAQGKNGAAPAERPNP
jgi:Skp family chaperone for outer membrane proteins